MTSLRGPAEYNHSQIEELGLSEEERWDKIFGFNKSRDMLGNKTPLGHAYSVILESLARNGCDATPNPKGFIEFIKQYQKRRTSMTDYELSLISLERSCLYPDTANAIADYLVEKRLPSKVCSDIMFQILGRWEWEFEPKEFDERNYVKILRNSRKVLKLFISRKL